MLKRIIIAFILVVVLASCTTTATPQPTLPPAPTLPPTQTPAATATSVPSPTAFTATPAPTRTITATATPGYPEAGYGPANFPSGINPLTGLKVAQPALLDRRPVVIKIENLPRENRPPWGVSQADIVYEYYTEQGGTRFAAVFYGQNAEKVGPIRSARFFDFNVVQMYKAVFIFGYAYADLFSAIMSSDFYNRLVLEGVNSSPALLRVEPNGPNHLLANTLLLPDVLKAKKIDNSIQKLDGMQFKLSAPAGGKPAVQLFARYSGSIYNRWDYDTSTGKYLRFVDAADDVNRNNEKYAPLTDRNTGKQVAVDNLVFVLVKHSYIKKTSETEVFDMKLVGEGPAYIARDGQLFEVKWKRAKISDVMTLVNKDGSLFPYKPGQTWVEVMGASSTIGDLKSGSWKFTWLNP